jgi:hypothetical protein
MKNLIFNKIFLFFFNLALLSVIIFNAFTFSAIQTETRVRHYMNGVGFPLAFYEWGGNPYIERFLPFGAAADIFIAFVYSFIIGIFFSYLWQRETEDTTRVR